MQFDDLLNRLWMFDSEVFAHDSLFVFISYKTKEEKVFHNCSGNEIQMWINEVNPILCGYNCNSYDKHILRCWLSGMTPEELKKVNDYIIVDNGNGWDIEVEYTKLPTMWDLFLCINPRKSLKELEGNLRLNITETTIPFDLPTKWTEEQYQEVLYYCRCDVNALMPIFDMLIDRYKSKYIIANLGKIDPEYALSLTDANITAELLGGTKIEHEDNFAYVYPSQVQKEKIPKEVLDYFDDIIAHNDLDYKVDAPTVKYGDCIVQLGKGGLHGAKESTFVYDISDNITCK